MTGELSASELDAMRAVAEAHLPNTCTIQTVSRSSDGQGGWSPTWANTYTSVPCKLRPYTGDRTDTTGDRFKAHSAWILSVHWDQAIASGYQVVMDSDTFTVIQVDDDHDWRILRRATMLRVDG